MTTVARIKEWFENGLKMGATHMIVVCDTFDYEDYPVYVKPDQDVRSVYSAYNSKDMQRIMEVYNLGMEMSAQLGRTRAMNF